MAGCASQLLMRTNKCKIAVSLMIKTGFRPLPGVMAAVTFNAVTTQVNIIHLVAGRTLMVYGCS